MNDLHWIFPPKTSHSHLVPFAYAKILPSFPQGGLIFFKKRSFQELPTHEPRTCTCLSDQTGAMWPLGVAGKAQLGSILFDSLMFYCFLRYRYSSAMHEYTQIAVAACSDWVNYSEMRLPTLINGTTLAKQMSELSQAQTWWIRCCHHQTNSRRPSWAARAAGASGYVWWLLLGIHQQYIGISTERWMSTRMKSNYLVCRNSTAILQFNFIVGCFIGENLHCYQVGAWKLAQRHCPGMTKDCTGEETFQSTLRVQAEFCNVFLWFQCHRIWMCLVFFFSTSTPCTSQACFPSSNMDSRFLPNIRLCSVIR